jgi:type 1 glutamine amidotransferase
MKNKMGINSLRSLRLILPLIALVIFNSSMVSAQSKVLIFCKTAGYHHDAIAVGIPAIQKLGTENKFSVDTTTNAAKFTPQNLKQYKAIIFLNTTGDVLNDDQQKVFEQYIKGGGGFMGIHSATDTEYDWPWYGNLVGAYFGGHPAQQTATLNIIDPKTSATKHLPNPWVRKDEWYSFKWMAEGLHELIAIDESSYNLNKIKPMGHHPMAWYHEYDGGRAFYTELGHTDESYSDPLYLQHILSGIQYAMTGKIK